MSNKMSNLVLHIPKYKHGNTETQKAPPFTYGITGLLGQVYPIWGVKTWACGPVWDGKGACTMWGANGVCTICDEAGYPIWVGKSVYNISGAKVL